VLRQSVTAAAIQRLPGAAGITAAERPTSSLSLLNTFVLSSEGRDISLPRSAQRLIAFLALHERTQARLHVACVLWVDAPEERAFANLRSALWRANHGGRITVESVSGLLKLSPQIAVDVWNARQTALRVLDPACADDPAQLATCLLDAELLPDWYEDWVLVERERFQQLRLHALEAASDRLTVHGRFAEALAVGLAAVAAEPLRESAHRVVIRAHLAEGNRSEALRQYRLCRHLIESSLGSRPSRTLENLATAFRAERP
jgi:DNA-binding SARP family transcriptional activator